jgi:hypothetical protein
VEHSFSLVVAEESAKLARVYVVVYGDKEVLVELKSCRELYQELPHTVQELGEDWRGFSDITCQVTTPTKIVIM